MFKLVSKVGTNFGVLDTRDGVLEWMDANTLTAYISNGIKIEGVSGGEFIPSKHILPFGLCNWNNGENIFKTGNLFRITSSGSFSFKSGKKAYKGKVISIEGNKYLSFTNGILVLFSEVEEYFN